MEFESRAITNTLLSTNVTITFQTEDESGKIVKYSRTLTDIKQGASKDDIYAAAEAISKLYENNGYDVKLITTNLIDNEE